MNALLPMKKDFRVVRIAEADAKGGSDHLKLLGRLMAENEAMYPGIESWFKSKVVPGLRSSSRIAFVGYDEERPVITAVVKRGKHAKFCHLRVADDFQDAGLGELFFALMALEVRRTAQEIHFTLPEGLWERRHGFFEGFGFTDARPSRVQYRLFEEELSCSAPSSVVWRSVLDRLPRLVSRFSVNRYSMCPRLLLSVRPEFVERLMAGVKTVEVRKKFSAKWVGERVALYSSSPVRALVGEATISDVKTDSPSAIWEAYGSLLGCSKDEFFSYANSSAEVHAIFLEQVTPYVEQISLSQVESLICEDLVAPQSYCAIESGRPWAKAVSMAALLHGSMRHRGGRLAGDALAL